MLEVNRNHGWPLALCAALCSLFLVAGAYAADAPKNLNELVAGAKKETTLRAMWSSRSLSGAKGMKQIVAAMNKKYGTNIKPQFTPGPSMTKMIGRLTRELKAGQPASTDVLWNNSGGMLKSSQVGLTRSMNWMAYLDRKMLESPGFDPLAPKGIGLASASTLVGIMYNSDVVKGDDIPKSMNDVFAPKWKGKIASTPYVAGLREFATPSLLGKEVMIDYAKKLSKHVGGLIRCGTVDRLTSGEFAMLVFSCGDQYVNQAKRDGLPLGYSVVNEAVVSHTRYGAVPVHSQAPNAAALFVAYLHSKEGQKWMWEVNGFDFHLYPESNERKILNEARARGAKLAVNSPQWLASQKDYRKTRKELEKIMQQK